VKTAGIILAAGASRRMGTPKALLRYEGQTFLDRLIGIFAPLCAKTIVVLGRDANLIRAGLENAGTAHFIINAKWELGQLSSLQCGLTALDSDTHAIFFTPVDCPAIQPQTPAALLASYKRGTRFAVPRFEGRHGHPVLFDAQLTAEFLTLHPDAAARDIVHRHVASTHYVDVDDAGVLRDIDEPADYEAMVGASRP
jgi:CTP:molybdopterin cytidylyltransferase MocA